MAKSDVTFRELGAKDLPLIHGWLNQPHMREFYQLEPISLERVISKYLPRTRGEMPVFSHIALLDGQPIGKIQCYRIAEYPQYGSEIGVDHGISVDLFIGDPSLIGRGFGKQMLSEYLRTVAFSLFPQEDSCYICHEVKNKAALATSKACGFKFVCEVVEDGANCELMVLEREDLALQKLN